MQEIRCFINENYVANTNLASLETNFIHTIDKCKKSFLGMILLEYVDFVNIVKTPWFIKKIFLKNLNWQKKVNISIKNDGYIWEVVKLIVKKSYIPKIHVVFQENIIKKSKKFTNKLYNIQLQYSISNYQLITKFFMKYKQHN